ncbi:hypothetical protein EXS57_01005 [Candidatus Kaiserbacteria bacterium]|nr:hypothetical protein [Candidatus Kaiserbacteria bacterium]
MKRCVVLHKNIGQTPLMVLHEWKRQNPTYAEVPVCYAGRLDPMASGKLLILLGEECKRQRVYSDLDKEYEIEVLLDIGSDTGDVLGLPMYAERETTVHKNIVDLLHKEQGAHMRAYPVFSSKTVRGKPLFLHALEGTLGDIGVPEHIESIYTIELQSLFSISAHQLEARILSLLEQVPHTDEPSKRLGEDFRVGAIRAQWKSLFEITQEREFTVLRLKVICASGTYMRSLAGRIGKSLQSKALALSITRTQIGKYVPLWRGMGWWSRTY